MEITRRGFASVAAAASAAVGLAACGGGSKGGSESKKFTYWSYWQSGETQQKIIQDALDEFTKATGIEVEVQWAGREVLTQVVPRLSSGNPPDLIDGPSVDFIGKLGEGNVLELNDLYEMDVEGESGTTVKDTIPEALTKSISNSKGPYCFPYSLAGEAIWFNGKITPELKENAPKTWDEFITWLEKRKAEGRSPIALDGDIKSYCGYWVCFAVIRAGGAGYFTESAADATGAKFNEQAWKDATEAIEQLIKGQYFPEGFRGTKFPTQQASWADQSTKTDIYLNGTWMPNETTESLKKAGDDPTSIEYGSFPFPAVGENKGEGVVMSGATGFAIPTRSRNADAVKKFLAFFANKDRVGRMATEAKSITARPDVEQAQELADYAKEYENATTIIPFEDDVYMHEPQWVSDIWEPAIDQFFAGTLDAAAFRNELAEKTKQYHESK